ncbi:MAG TPA: hypothetical protein VJS64_13035 [Pyrinomonadaceae bacterium]|nr:hypothetical protein [Pyrinomonadaceae bacterium]
MVATSRKKWVRVAIILVVVYCVIGAGFGELANTAATEQGRFTWRLGAGINSLVKGAPALPVPSGQFGVGRVAYHWIDASRSEPLSSQSGGRRELMVYVWYPVAKSKTDLKTAPYIDDFPSVQKVISETDLNDMFRPAPYSMIREAGLPRTHTVEGAKTASWATARYPTLIFSHGWGNTTLLYTAELEELVSHGYVIAAVDHTYDTTFTVFPDNRVIQFAQAVFDAETKKPGGYVNYAKARAEVMAVDVRFVIDQLAVYNKRRSLGAPFAGHLDLRRIGALGHSIGGLASVRACQIDPRIRACVNQDSDVDDGAPFILTTPTGKKLDQPFLFFAVNADKFSPSVVNPTEEQLDKMKLTRPEYDKIILRQQKVQNDALASVRGGSYRVILDLPSITHRSFSDLPLLAAGDDPTKTSDGLHNFQLVVAYTRAFFDKYLKRQKSALLDQKSSIDPKVRVDSFVPSLQ